MIACAIFANSLKFKIMALWMSCFFLIMSIVVLFELLRYFPSDKKSSFLTKAFKVNLMTVLGALIFFCFIEYRDVWNLLGIWYVFLWVFYSWLLFNKRFSVYDRLITKKPFKSKLVRIMTKIVLLIIALSLVILTALVAIVKLNELADTLKTKIEKTEKSMK
ncbi:MAG: hypothetical protein D4R64_10885 [Porphyromonadaceae bacterium]|nr:MAG: hypothetical protein D4R64_10885 [Porphyromonadaceae bacterium]